MYCSRKTIPFLSLLMCKNQSHLFGIAVIVIICKRKANMALLFCATLHVIFSIASGLDADIWREAIEKRLSSLEQFNVHLQEENAKSSVPYFRNST